MEIAPLRSFSEKSPQSTPNARSPASGRPMSVTKRQHRRSGGRGGKMKAKTRPRKTAGVLLAEPGGRLAPGRGSGLFLLLLRLLCFFAMTVISFGHAGTLAKGGVEVSRFSLRIASAAGGFRAAEAPVKKGTAVPPAAPAFSSLWPVRTIAESAPRARPVAGQTSRDALPVRRECAFPRPNDPSCG